MQKRQIILFDRLPDGYYIVKLLDEDIKAFWNNKKQVWYDGTFRYFHPNCTDKIYKKIKR